ncbi:hypothetical protein HUS23_10970 [Ectothiorhodospiraceae bacterium 2226]|nr:hypothetical protein HUS23_10970 [Ectothiorhodospiraceae bacterium 2226]
MDVNEHRDGKLQLSFELDEARDLAKDVAENMEDMPGALLDLANLLQSAYYEAKDEFRQPPHPWAPGTRHPHSV